MEYPPYSIYVWDSGIWHLSAHHPSRMAALIAARALSTHMGAHRIRVWDNTTRTPLQGWAGDTPGIHDD